MGFLNHLFSAIGVSTSKCDGRRARRATVIPVLLTLLLLLSALPSTAQIGESGPLNPNYNYAGAPDAWNPEVVQPANKYLVRQFVKDGSLIDEIVVPGRPPTNFRAPAVSEPVSNQALGVVILPNMPAFDWCYGCSATSAAMIMGYYDNTSYPNMYAGPTNGGVCPMSNCSWWGAGECPLSATHQGYDGRGIRGHVDDYWRAFGNCDPDPYVGNWTEHTQGECTADPMGTNQSKYSNCDGSTTFYFYSNGSPLCDYTGCEPAQKDGCHGLRVFVQSRGYSVDANCSQYIYGYNDNTLGFTFAQFMSEIDAGRPVMIQVAGHSMVGYGYDSSTQTVYVRDTWDCDPSLTHQMTWGGSYSGLQHYGVTVLRLTPETTPPTVVSVNRQSPMAENTGVANVTWRVTFSEPVDASTVSKTDFTLVDVGGTISGEFVSGTSPTTGSTTTIDVTAYTGSASSNGTLRLDVLAAATISDLAGNDYNSDFTTGQTYNIDKTRPTVLSVERQSPAGQYTNSSSVTWRVTFSEPVDAARVSVSDFTLVDVGGTITGESKTSTAPTTGYTPTIDVTVDTGSGDGTLRLDVPAAATIYDIADNDIDTSYTSGQTYIVDRTAPSISSVIAEPALNAAGDQVHVTVTVTDNNEVASVKANTFSLTHGSGDTWTGDVTADSAEGDHAVAVEARDATDNLATDNGESYTVLPVVFVAGRYPAPSMTAWTSSHYLFRFCGRATIIDTNSFALDPGAGMTLTVIAPGYTGIADNDLVMARGVLDVGAGTLTCDPANLTKY